MPNHSFGGGQFNEENHSALCGRNAESSAMPESVKTISSVGGGGALRRRETIMHFILEINPLIYTL
jgi:hypothetical protein